MMTLEEQKLAVCEKLPELIVHSTASSLFYWRRDPDKICRPIYWPTEGLQVCHEAEKLSTALQQDEYVNKLCEEVIKQTSWLNYDSCHATYEQRLEALTRVWFPEKWK